MRLPVLLFFIVFLLPAITLADESVLLTGDVQIRLGDAFMADGEYYRAITEYKKYLILFPDGNRSDAALFNTGMASFRGMEYDSAIASFVAVRTRFAKSPLAVESAYYEGICYARLNQLEKAAQAFDAAATSSQMPETAARARLGGSLVAFDRDHISETRDDLIRFLTEFPGNSRTRNVTSALALLRKDGEAPRKSPVIAGILSALVPGSGHMYAEHYGDGATALLLNGLFIAGTVVAVQQENYAVAGIVGVIGLPFYVGNIYGAANAATKWNIGVRKGLRDRLTLALDYSF